tara:strand:- start:75 stop:203 length:129 start_codon:yes stop_codon:yes gene_type:complete
LHELGKDLLFNLFNFLDIGVGLDQAASKQRKCVFLNFLIEGS